MSRQQRTLRTPVFHILLALAGEDLHGLGIADEVEHATDGAVELGPGTLYRSLKEMSESGMIEEIAAPAEDADPRRRYYRITSRGRVLLADEAGRMARVVDLARQRSVLREGDT
jgi:DNA-binding PadR family transcriptional regulator